MSREIVFKAKRKDNGEWVEGYYVFCRKCHYILPAVNEIIGYDEREDEWIEIDPNTLCQYTGLHDKNGKKIWENDIISHDLAKAIGSVKWYEKDYVGWCVDEIYDDAQQFDVDMLKECEVIGNIFDNADLLEVE